MANELPPLPQWLALTAEQDRDLRACIDAYARAAVLAEREACAKACDELVSGTYKIPGLYPEAVFGKRCAAAIRARITP